MLGSAAPVAPSPGASGERPDHVLARRERDGWGWRDTERKEGDLDPSSPHHATPRTEEKDGLGRVRRLIEMDAGREVVTRHDLDPLGNLVALTDPRGVLRRYEFDGRSRQTAVIDPNAGRWTDAHDDADALVARQDPASRRRRVTGDRPLPPRRALPGPPVPRPRGRATRPGSRTRPARSISAATAADASPTRCAAGPTARSIAYGRSTRPPAASRAAASPTPAASPSPTTSEDSSAPPAASSPTRPGPRTAASTARASATAWRTRDRPAGQILRDLTFSYDPASHLRAILDGRSGIEPLFDLSAEYELDDRERLVRATDRVAATTRHHDDVGNVQRVSSEHDEPALDAEHRHGEDGAGPDQLTSVGGEPLRSFDGVRAVKLLPDADADADAPAEAAHGTSDGAGTARPDVETGL